jgi:hypothetical protein
MWDNSSNDVWAASGNSIYHWDGAQWTGVVQTRREDAAALWGVSGSGPEDVWTMDFDYGFAIRHWDGEGWSAPTTLEQGGPFAWDLWVAGPNDVWVFEVGSAQILHGDGIAFSPSWSADMNVAPPRFIVDVWGSRPDDIWAVGTIILHWDGTGWSELPSPTSAQLVVMGGSGADDVWAFGPADSSNRAPVIHWDGTAWSEAPALPVINEGWPVAVWAADPNNAWVIFEIPSPLLCQIFHWNGTDWLEDTTKGLSESFAGVYPAGLWGSGPNDVWAVGKSIWHWNGRAWSKDTSVAVDAALHAVWGSGRGDLWAVGDLGLVIHRR